jgi:hypothetical protein
MVHIDGHFAQQAKAAPRVTAQRAGHGVTRDIARIRSARFRAFPAVDMS